MNRMHIGINSKHPRVFFNYLFKEGIFATTTSRTKEKIAMYFDAQRWEVQAPPHPLSSPIGQKMPCLVWTIKHFKHPSTDHQELPSSI